MHSLSFVKFNVICCVGKHFALEEINGIENDSVFINRNEHTLAALHVLLRSVL